MNKMRSENTLEGLIGWPIHPIKMFKSEPQCSQRLAKHRERANQFRPIRCAARIWFLVMELKP
jgi:hypothetical protein